ncbi:EVE domain-containing protein [Gracilimonas mengyeensis]|nr:EVE domain-containing protein [Gracilimonas mengyeensis]
MNDEDQKFTWVQTHKELVEYLKDKEDDQEVLIKLLSDAGITGLHDEEIKGTRKDLEEIDPFTFFCFINKYPRRRIKILQNIADQLDITIPEDDLGVPSAQGQKVMMFPFSYDRKDNEISALWRFFFDALLDSIDDFQFSEILNQYGVGPVKITEALFYIDPENYFPINGPTKPYLRSVLEIEPTFESYTEYQAILEEVRQKTETPFYELSHIAWEWNNRYKAMIEKWENLQQDYKVHRKENGLVDEIYKWEAVQHFQDTFDLEADDFAANLKDAISKSYNLVYQNSKGFIIKAATYFPEEVRKMFRLLYNEEESLEQRLLDFEGQAEELVPKVSEAHGKELNHQQDERTLSFYLTMRFPEQYPIYKDDVYQYLLSEVANQESKSAGEKYLHYLELAGELVPTIEEDQELVKTVRNQLSEDCYTGEQKWLIFQDILWVNMRGNTESNYWLFQGNPSVFDIEQSLKDGALSSWRVNAHKDKIRPGDKVILWVSGNKRGCYALGEVESEVQENTAKEDELPYYKEHDKENGFDQVELKITHNLANNPITYDQIKNVPELADLKIGNQGTNFSATKEEYDALLATAKVKLNTKRYWLYSPGPNANKWEEFHSDGVMRLGWEDLGDLAQYDSKDEIVKALQDLFDTDSSKKNDATANWEFLHEIKIGDAVIAKKGRSEYIGYGIVESEYFYEESRDNFKSTRKVNWFKKGSWEEPKGDNVVKTLTDITPYPDYVARIKKIMGIEESKMLKKEINYPLNTIFYGPPGTGKTYNTIKRAAEIVEDRRIENYVEAKEIFNDQLGETIEFITFHQNYSYEDFIQGLRPDIENSQQLTFERTDGIFKKLADNALKNWKASRSPQTKKQSFERVFNEYIQPLVEGEVEELEVQMKRVSYYITAVTDKSIEFRKSNGATSHTLSINTLRKMYEAESVLEIQGLSSYYSPLLEELLDIGKSPGETEQVDLKNYVIIIDEINRANISRVFGELITLIEPDKRLGRELHIPAKLPSGESFSVPENLYIIGTMNTADKSIALLDIALRRRFDFEAMYPEYIIEDQQIYDVDVLKMINERIIKLKGHDFQIGHSYFMDEELSLKKRMNRKVIPLLLEYFMNDEKEVKDILSHAGLEVEDNSWPLRITGKK